MIKILPCIPISLSMNVLVPKMTYKPLPAISLVLLYPPLWSYLWPLHTSHTGLPTLSLIWWAISRLETLYLLSSLRPMMFTLRCLSDSFPHLSDLHQIFTQMLFSQWQLLNLKLWCTVHSHPKSIHFALFFIIARITSRYAKYFSCLFLIVILVF